MKIPIYQPYLPPSFDNAKYASEAIKSAWISSVGKYTSLAAEKIAEITEAPHVLLCNSGSSAVHIAARILKQFYPSVSEITTGNATYVAALNGVITERDFKVKIHDVKKDTWNIDLDKIDYTPQAFLSVSNIGNVVDPALIKARFPNAPIIEDACEIFTGKYRDGSPVGSSKNSVCAAISFFANKQITAAEGGALLIQDKEVFEYAKVLCGQGISEKRYIHNELGFNYRMNNIVEGLLLAQIELLPQILELKSTIFNKYRKEIGEMEGVKVQTYEEGTTPADWMFGIQVDSDLAINFEHADGFFKYRGIEIRPMFYPYSEHRFVRDSSLIEIMDQEDNAIEVNRCAIILPSFPELTEKQQDYILKVLREYLETLQNLKK